MNWSNARNSAALLAERLKKFDKSAVAEPAPPPARSLPETVYVKPPRAMTPPPEMIAEAITAELADIMDDPIDGPAAENVGAGAGKVDDRIAPRKTQSLPAYITAPGMSNIIPARVVDMSATGAKIELTPMGRSTGIPLGYLPERFVLVLKQDRMEVDCETVWQEQWLMGVRFLGFPRPTKEKR